MVNRLWFGAGNERLEAGIFPYWIPLRVPARVLEEGAVRCTQKASQKRNRFVGLAKNGVDPREPL